ncbi:enoyl-CoA hydratase-related protein [Aldersonia kunmingensis]|uniref:enoyl-CoA hydratase-related protein n=1 Tax=Aldersonia kunmingensis TaxID=408066 RepID=UPI003CCC122F
MSSPVENAVLVEQQGPVLVITLNRPDQRNALDAATMSGIGCALTDAEHDDAVAVVVLTGAGDRSFCAGLDLKAFAAGGRPPLPVEGPGLDVLLTRTYPKPVVAAANGSAFAAGFELLLACDIIVAADHAKFGIPEVKRGLVAAGGGITQLPRRIPLAIALELGLTGDSIDADRAYSLGLVNRVVPGAEVAATALAIAQTIAANAPLAVRFTKEHMHAATAADTARQTVHARLPEILTSADAAEGARAFAERRPPAWAGR